MLFLTQHVSYFYTTQWKIHFIMNGHHVDQSFIAIVLDISLILPPFLEVAIQIISDGLRWHMLRRVKENLYLPKLHN